MITDIEQAAENYAKNVHLNFSHKDAEYNYTLKDFKAGAVWQQSQQPKDLQDLQVQVRDHIRNHNLFDWEEALTDNEMIYLENLLLTFNPLCPPGSIGFEEQKKHISNQSQQPKEAESDAIEFAEWVEANFNNYGLHGKYSWSKKFPYQNTMLQVSTEELYKLFKNNQ